MGISDSAMDRVGLKVSHKMIWEMTNKSMLNNDRKVNKANDGIIDT